MAIKKAIKRRKKVLKDAIRKQRQRIGTGEKGLIPQAEKNTFGVEF